MIQLNISQELINNVNIRVAVNLPEPPVRALRLREEELVEAGEAGCVYLLDAGGGSGAVRVGGCAELLGVNFGVRGRSGGRRGRRVGGGVRLILVALLRTFWRHFEAPLCRKANFAAGEVLRTIDLGRLFSQRGLECAEANVD